MPVEPRRRRRAQYERTGKIGNVDLRLAGVGDRAVVLVGANDRSNDTIRFWSLDPGTGALTLMEAGNLPTGAGNYAGLVNVTRLVRPDARTKWGPHVGTSPE